MTFCFTFGGTALPVRVSVRRTKSCLEILYRLGVGLPLVLARDHIGTRIVVTAALAGSLTENHLCKSQIMVSLAAAHWVCGQLQHPIGVARLD
jgi:hypothetical protein